MTKRPFDAAPPPADLGRASVRSGFIKLTAKGLRYVLAIGSAMVLARLLEPADFGLIAMVASLTLFVSGIKDLGLPFAAVHQPELNRNQLNNLFWITLALNLATSFFMALLAPGLAWFYGESRLTLITLVIAGALFLTGLTVQHESLLMRRMRFGTLMAIDLGAMTLSALVAIGAAFAGAGYWALVWQFVVSAAARTILFWRLCDWRPSWRKRTRRASVRPMLTYGLFLTLDRMLRRLARSLDRILVGYFGGAQVLGLYAAAWRWSRFPVQQVQVPLGDVAVSGFSRIQHDPGAFRAFCRKGFFPMFSLVVPLLVLLAVEGQSAVLLLLGPKWVQAIPLFRLFCVVSLCATVGHITRWLYQSQGHTRRQLRWSLIETPVLVLAVVAGVPHGAYGIAVAVTAATVLLTYPSLLFCLRTSHLRLSDFHAIVWRPVLATLVAGAAYGFAHHVLPAPSQLLLRFILRSLLFFCLYGLVWTTLPGGRGAFRDMLRLGSRVAASLRPSRAPAPP